MPTLLGVAKALEELGRRAAFSALTRGSRRARRVERGAIAGPVRTLVIAEDAIGDTILTLPAIRAMHDAHPGNAVDVATWDMSALLFRGLPYVRRVLTFPRYDPRRLDAAMVIRRHAPYDVVVDTMVLRRHVRSRSFAMMLASGARFWIGEDDRGSDYLLNVRVPRAADGTPHLSRMLALAEPFGGVIQHRRPWLVVSGPERRAAAEAWAGSGMRVLVNVSTNGSERQWEPLRFASVVAQLCRRLPASRILITALERDRLMAANAAAAGTRETTRVVVPSLRELIALVESADLVVSPDTAVCHMASAFCRPLVSLHNAQKSQWLPFDTPGRRVIGPSPNSFDMITVRRVVTALDAVLGEMEPARITSASRERGATA